MTRSAQQPRTDPVFPDPTDDDPSYRGSIAAGGQARSFWPSVLALGVGGFAIGTGEFVIMGLLPEVAKDLAIAIRKPGTSSAPMRSAS